MRVIHGSIIYSHHGLIMVRCLININTKEFRELRRGNDDCSSVSKTIDYRMGKKVYNHSETQNAKRKLKDTNNKCQYDGVGDKLGRSGGGQRLKGCS